MLPFHRCPLLPHTQPFTNLFTPQLHLIFLSYCILTPNASPSWEDRHLPVRWWTLASTKCRTLGQKNGMLKCRTDMFSNPMRRGWGSSGGPTGQGQVPGALNVEEGFAQVSSGSIRTYQQQHLSIYTTTHDHAGSLCMWLIALFQVEMMQWIPLGHVEHRMFMGSCPKCPECPKCVRDVRFQTGHFGHLRT